MWSLLVVGLVNMVVDTGSIN